MRDALKSATSVLVGKSLWKWNRASNMATFDFGRKTIIHDGKSKEVGEWALDVQCAWRFVRGEQVVVGSRDVYYPVPYDENKGIPPDFDWEREPNRRDRMLSELFVENSKEFVVQTVQVGGAGNLQIALDDGLFLELFTDDSLPSEHWRLFQVGKPGHFVVTG